MYAAPLAPRSRRVILLTLLWMSVCLLLLPNRPGSFAQEDAGPRAAEGSGVEGAGNEPEDALSDASVANEDEGLNLFLLLWESRWWMLPILLMSFIAVAASVERFIGLRRNRLLPKPLVDELGRLGSASGGFEPREAFRACQRYPSAAANVIKAMLVKVGRPHSEVEHTVQEASEREAQRQYNNVRWLNLAAGVCPLMGLMGTVWGMIQAFHETTRMLPGQNKAEALAQGIYLALVTTLGGLAVAIPATILSHYFEGRIVNLFHEIDELLFNLMPHVERYEGRVRFGAPVDGDAVVRPDAPRPAGGSAAPARAT